jgi:hypothetical protein
MQKPAALVVALLASSALAEPKRDLHAQYTIDRAHAEKVPSMKGNYIDPCDAPGKQRRWWKPHATPALDEARAELERYRNVLGCKSIKVDHVPAADRETAWHAAMKRNDAAAAKQAARELFDSAMAVEVDRAFVKQRMLEMAPFRSSTKIAAAARPRIAALFADADRELAAGRIGSANMILNYLVTEAMDHFDP